MRFWGKKCVFGAKNEKKIKIKLCILEGNEKFFL
jgi:hypothetical protein